jgi:hypothetical protein
VASTMQNRHYLEEPFKFPSFDIVSKALYILMALLDFWAAEKKDG